MAQVAHSHILRNDSGVLDRLTHSDVFNESNRRLTVTCTGSLPVPLLLVAPPLISVNGYVLVILYVLFAFSAVTPNLPSNRLLGPRQLTACSLITRADVEEAVGRIVNDEDEEIQRRSSTCHYATNGGLVSITLQKLTAKPDLQLEIAALKRELPDAVVRDAPGFPKAFYLDLPDIGTQLHIAKDNAQHLMISILGFGNASQVSGAAAQIARKAMRRL